MSADANIEAAVEIQKALNVLATLQLTSYLFPGRANVNDGDHFDFIIVGGGTAGCVIANRLTEIEEFNVLLIEAGDDPPIEVLLPGLFNFVSHSRLDWNYTAQKDANAQSCGVDAPIDTTIGKMLGGSSGINYMFYSRGHHRDFDSWAKIVNDTSWEWKEIIKYFIKSEKLLDNDVLESPTGVYHGTDGYLGVTREPSDDVTEYLEAVRELGNKVVIDNNGYDTLGYSQPMLTIAEGFRQTTSYSFLKNINRQNLKVLRNAFVSNVIFDENYAAVGVKVIISNYTLTLYADKEIILSAGALNTPKLLMLSGIGPEDHLKNLNIKVIADLPVGLYLQDHATVFMSHRMNRLTSQPKPLDPTKFPIPSVSGYVAFNKSKSSPDYLMTIFFVPKSSKGLQLFSFNYRDKYKIGQLLSDANLDRNTIISILCKLHPKSRGRVMLRSADPNDSPLIYTGYYSDESDLDDTVDYLLDYLQITNTSYFRNVNAEFVDLSLGRCGGNALGSEEYWRCYARCVLNGLYHYSGSCAMGGVLDAGLRVRGVRRLRVADASAMPHLTSGYINAPVIMIAEKAADMIKNDNISKK